ncbi:MULTISPECIES: hypothetical protein [Arthrobacter]|uniref:DUF5666 domain-containing protein n=2 Tax=Arthrobacter TaxID=1663 RepID=A0ABU9KHK6_9MICC|nr:hypothetical protein [Arthrobacter sp. YJM1]MDP5226622.1 hypothetical protein [Arthrobacter sp. YJM1]
MNSNQQPAEDPRAQNPGPQNPGVPGPGVPAQGTPAPGTQPQPPVPPAATQPLPSYQGQGSYPGQGSYQSQGAPGGYPQQQPPAGGVPRPAQRPAAPKGKGWAGMPTGGKVAILAGAGVVLLLAGGGGGFAIGHATAGHTTQGRQLRQGNGTGQYPGFGQGQGTPGGGSGQQGGTRGPGGLGGLGSALHGEFVVSQNGTYVTMVEQRGQITAVSSTRVTVKSSDGFEQSYTINSQTVTRSQSSLATGQTVQVTATKDGLVAQTILQAGGGGASSGSSSNGSSGNGN